jgi:hypothetical protein
MQWSYVVACSSTYCCPCFFFFLACQQLWQPRSLIWEPMLSTNNWYLQIQRKQQEHSPFCITARCTDRLGRWGRWTWVGDDASPHVICVYFCTFWKQLLVNGNCLLEQKLSLLSETVGTNQLTLLWQFMNWIFVKWRIPVFLFIMVPKEIADQRAQKNIEFSSQPICSFRFLRYFI